MIRNVQLTEENVAVASRRKVLVSLLGAAFVFAALNLALRPLLDGHTSNRGYWLIRTKWTMVERLERPVDWLLLGDSACNQGLRPDILAARLGGRVLNTCTLGDMLVVHDAWMLQRHIERVGPPKHVVVSHVYDVWHRRVGRRFRGSLMGRIPRPWGFWNDMRPPIRASLEDVGLLLVERWVPLYTENRTLAGWAMDPARAFSTEFALDADGYMQVDEAKPDEVRKDVARHLDFLADHPLAFAPDNRLALREIIRLADEHDFDVYLVSSPIARTLAEVPAYRDYAEALLGELREVASESARVHLVLEQPVTFEETEMENADHLTHASAEVYSRRVADAILGTRKPRRIRLR
jgi:hypothetical protein